MPDTLTDVRIRHRLPDGWEHDTAGITKKDARLADLFDDEY